MCMSWSAPLFRESAGQQRTCPGPLDSRLPVKVAVNAIGSLDNVPELNRASARGMSVKRGMTNHGAKVGRRLRKDTSSSVCKESQMC